MSRWVLEADVYRLRKALIATAPKNKAERARLGELLGRAEARLRALGGESAGGDWTFA